MLINYIKFLFIHIIYDLIISFLLYRYNPTTIDNPTIIYAVLIIGIKDIFKALLLQDSS